MDYPPWGKHAADNLSPMAALRNLPCQMLKYPPVINTVVKTSDLIGLKLWGKGRMMPEFAKKTFQVFGSIHSMIDYLLSMHIIEYLDGKDTS